MTETNRNLEPIRIFIGSSIKNIDIFAESGRNITSGNSSSDKLNTLLLCRLEAFIKDLLAIYSIAI